MYKKFIDINLFFKLMTGDRVDSNSEHGSGPCLEQITYKAPLLCEGLVATACYQTQNSSNHGITLTHYIFFPFSDP